MIASCQITVRVCEGVPYIRRGWVGGYPLLALIEPGK